MKSTINFNHAPDYLLQHELLNHQDDLFEHYSKLLMLRIDFAYRKASKSFKYADTYQITADMTWLIEQVNCISGIVGFVWVLEYGEKHHLHIHAAFYINGQLHRKVWRFWEYIHDIWEEVTEGEGYAHHCEPKPYYPVPGERVIEYSDEDGRSDMKYILSYLGKDSQRTERRIYQVSDIPTERQIGRKRNKN